MIAAICFYGLIAGLLVFCVVLYKDARRRDRLDALRGRPRR